MLHTTAVVSSHKLLRACVAMGERGRRPAGAAGAAAAEMAGFQSIPMVLGRPDNLTAFDDVDGDPSSPVQLLPCMMPHLFACLGPRHARGAC